MSSQFPLSLFSAVWGPYDQLLGFLGIKAVKYKTKEVTNASGVTRVKGQPGQLTNKQLSRRSAERRLHVVGWEGKPLTETHHRSFLDFNI